MARIVISGYMIRHPVAGMAMAYMHYALGFARLGHDVSYIEESGWPESCYNPLTLQMGNDPLAGMNWVAKLAKTCELELPLYYVDRDTRTLYGGEWDDLTRHLDSADLLLNLGGVCWLPEFERCACRAYIDMDPGFTQLGRFGAEAIGNHHAYFTYGANIGQPDCAIPDDGINWRPTVPPVVASLWQWPTDKPRNDAFTTIANWNPYGSVTDGTLRLGQKHEEFLRIIELPHHTSQPLELAIAGADGEVEKNLLAAGWRVSSARQVSAHFDEYKAFILQSRGEFSVAKHGYVVTNSGWFSDRSVCYLAAGRPVVLQDTGFSNWLPTGCGVLAFSNLEEAIVCIDTVNMDYATHADSAREIAEAAFGYRAVLTRLLEEALNRPGSTSS
jgi:hypothetical protein